MASTSSGIKNPSLQKREPRLHVATNPASPAVQESDQSALNRDILSGLTQATSGNKALHISFSADYALSKYLTLTAFYDYQFNKPLLTTSSYPTRTQDFGISLKFILNR